MFWIVGFNARDVHCKKTGVSFPSTWNYAIEDQQIIIIIIIIIIIMC